MPLRPLLSSNDPSLALKPIPRMSSLELLTTLLKSAIPSPLSLAIADISVIPPAKLAPALVNADNASVRFCSSAANTLLLACNIVMLASNTPLDTLPAVSASLAAPSPIIGTIPNRPPAIPLVASMVFSSPACSSSKLVLISSELALMGFFARSS